MPIPSSQTLNQSVVLAELLPQLKQLSHTDKLELLNFLTTELLDGVGTKPLADETANPLRTSYVAASVLTMTLAEHQATSHD
jgi:hypothetical protein